MMIIVTPFSLIGSVSEPFSFLKAVCTYEVVGKLDRCWIRRCILKIDDNELFVAVGWKQ